MPARIKTEKRMSDNQKPDTVVGMKELFIGCKNGKIEFLKLSAMNKFSMLHNFCVVLYSEPFHHQQWEFLQFEVDGQEQNDSRDQDLVSNDTTTMLSMLNCPL